MSHLARGSAFGETKGFEFQGIKGRSEVLSLSVHCSDVPSSFVYYLGVRSFAAYLSDVLSFFVDFSDVRSSSLSCSEKLG